jgi:hypothetical protein
MFKIPYSPIAQRSLLRELSRHDRTIICIVCITFLCSYVLFRGRIALLRVQYLCSSHVDPPETIAYDGYPKTSSILLKTKPREYVFRINTVRHFLRP